MNIHDIEITLDPALVKRLRCETPERTSTTDATFEAYNTLGQVVMSFSTKATARTYADAYDLSIRPIKESS